MCARRIFGDGCVAVLVLCMAAAEGCREASEAVCVYVLWLPLGLRFTSFIGWARLSDGSGAFCGLWYRLGCAVGAGGDAVCWVLRGGLGIARNVGTFTAFFRIELYVSCSVSVPVFRKT